MVDIISLANISKHDNKHMMNKCRHIIGSPYSNIIIVNCKGNLLATISKRKADWYIKRKLAKEMVPPPPGYPRAIKLNFEADVERNPKPFEINVNENKCVICGKENELTRHHVIPWVIRRYFPLKHKNYSRQWCVLLCVDCHEEVEMLTQPLYKSDFPKGVAARKNTDLTLQMIKDKGHLDKLSPDKLSILLERSTYKTVAEIPPYRTKNKAASRYSLKTLHEIEIKKWALKFIKDHDGIKGVKDYFRGIFLTMKPKFLPSGYLDLPETS